MHSNTKWKHDLKKIIQEKNTMSNNYHIKATLNSNNLLYSRVI